MTIEIKNLEIDAIIGILPKERKESQSILVDLYAQYDYLDGVYVDYANLANLIETTLIKEKFELIEEALLNIKEQIFKLYPIIYTLELRIQKPNIIDNCFVGVSQKWERDR